MTEKDARHLMAQIEQEVRNRRASGDFPAELERELDLLFESLSPPGAGKDRLGAVLDRAERSCFINIDVPTESTRPGVAPVKRVIRKAIAWYMQYIAQQVTDHASASVRSMRLLAEYGGQVEEAALGSALRVLNEARRAPYRPDLAPWTSLCEQLFKRAEGRVLHAECADSALLGTLVEAGVDAYGVDPVQETAEEAAGRGADVRPQGCAEHLRSLTEMTLGGLILSGCTDSAPRGAQIELADLASAALINGAPILLLGTMPQEWNTNVDGVQADLALGKPLHPQTWIYLLERRGFRSLTSRAGSKDLSPLTYAVLGTRARRA